MNANPYQAPENRAYSMNEVRSRDGFELKFLITREDLVAFSLYYHRTRRTVLRTLFLFSLLAISILVVTIPALSRGEDRSYEIGTFLIMVAVMAVLFSVSFRWRTSWELRKSLPEFQTQILGVRKIQITNTHLTEVTQDTEVKIRLSSLKPIIDSTAHFFLTLGPHQAFIIPKSVFSSPEVAASFRAEVDRAIASARR